MSLTMAVNMVDETTPSAQPEPAIEVSDLVKRFRRASGAEFNAVDHVSLRVDPSEFVVLLGPSGCGKTTLLRCIAGLETPDSGAITTPKTTLFSSSAGIDLPAEQRDLSMIFQSYALWPHMTVFQNVAYPLKARRVRKAEIRDRVERVLTMVDIHDLERQYPSQMSGGQQQRVALARALVANENLVLFDEPLSNVDAKVREQLRAELIGMQENLGFAALYVTHDQSEAMSMADRIAVIANGRIAQLAAPEEVYERPLDRYVANFIGVNNEIPGRLMAAEDDGTCQLSTDIGGVRGTLAGDGTVAASRVVATCRPERMTISQERTMVDNCWSGSVVRSVYMGTHVEILVRTGDLELRVWRHDAATIEPGTDVWVTVDPRHVRVLDGGDPAIPDRAPAGT